MRNLLKALARKEFLLLVAIILSPLFCQLAAANNSPQFQLGDKLSVFSDKAYRKNNGKYFEAVGNVVIISQNDTIYGELASFNQETLEIKMEGNVRVVTKDLTLYGSKIEYNLETGRATIINARIMAMDFNIVANKLIRMDQNTYFAHEAEFTTCQDCTESWAIYGKEIRVDVGQFVRVKHGLAKIKGVDVLYIPYILLPIQTKRKTGLLFPNISTRPGEGLAFEQPIFWAIDDSKDATFSPTFWAERGYGGDFQYRQRFSDMSWLEVNSRLLNDTIYQPGMNNSSDSGEQYFRHFTQAETHQQFSPNFGSHLRYTGARDLDIVRDHPMYTDNKINSSDLGLTGFADYRRNYFSLGLSAQYLQNQLHDDPEEFDRQYVQVMPRIHFSGTPYTLYQSKTFMLNHLTFGFDGNLTRFSQVHEEEDNFIRNAIRTSVKPYLHWHLFNLGPVSLSTRYTWDQQNYKFKDHNFGQFAKSAGLHRTELSFTMDKVFGLSYEEKILVKDIPERELDKLKTEKEKGLTPLKKDEKVNRLVGDLPNFEKNLTTDYIVQKRNSYRHSQDFKLIHHYISAQNDFGNKRWREQINDYRGWFDYDDAIRSTEYLYGANTTRTVIPPQNTLELQWNNTLIRKTPKDFNYLTDNRYLRDNFDYRKISWFNISQGYMLNQIDGSEDELERLTRFKLQAGYQTEKWLLNLEEYYFHAEKRNIFTMNFNRQFDHLRLLAAYNYNSFGENNLHTVKGGGQVRPTDYLGFAILKEMDLEAKENIRTLYTLDIMPHNNCWILSLNYRESLVDTRFSFNFLFNFGSSQYSEYRDNYFGIRRE